MKNQISINYFSYTIFKALVCFLLFKINCSAPINSSVTYANFLKEIQHDNCVFPKNVALPFNSSDTFEYLEVHIKICTPSEEKNLKRSREAINLCSDIFNTLKNITCHSDNKAHLPVIKIEFSKNVCTDISSLKFSPESETLLKHLTDKFVCDMMCDDEFNPACQVLLWSYQVQQQINSASAVQEKNEQKDSIDKGNPESSKLEEVQNEIVADTANKDKIDFDNKVNSEINKPSNKEISPAVKLEKTNNLVPPSNNDTTPAGENSNTANVKPISIDEKEKSETIPEGLPVINGNDIENQEKSELLNKEKEINPQTPNMDTKEADQEKQNLVNVDELSVKHNEIQTNNLEKTAILNKSKSSDANVKKPVAENAGLVEEVGPNDQNAVQSGKLAETTTNSNKSETKIKTPTTAKIETTNVAKTIPETKDLNVISEKIKTKNAKISTLRTEEKVGAIEIANQNTMSESETKEINSQNDVSPITTAADLEKMEDGIEMPEPSDKNQEPYKEDMESEGEYSKLDYADDADDGFYDNSKNIKPELVEDSKMPVVETQNDLPKYDVYQPRNSIGRGVEDIQVIPAFPEQEDSHFFFYFLSIVLILMGGYLLFHNKQKIIALIVEGRHERRRRSHGVGYKKLETK